MEPCKWQEQILEMPEFMEPTCSKQLKIILIYSLAAGTPDTREGGAFSTTALTDLGIDKTDGVSGHNLLSGVEGNDWDTSGTTGYGESKSDITKSVVSECS